MSLIDVFRQNGISRSGVGGRKGDRAKDRDDGFEQDLRGRAGPGQNGFGSVHGDSHNRFRSTRQRLAINGLTCTYSPHRASLSVHRCHIWPAHDGQQKTIQAQRNSISVQRISSSLLARNAIRGKDFAIRIHTMC